MTLDEAFESKEKMAIAVKQQVSLSMKEFGVMVIKALMTDMQPDATVMASMNRYAMRNIEKFHLDGCPCVQDGEAGKHMACE